MADSGCRSDQPHAICHTCVIVLEKYGTTESVVPWLCECNQKTSESKANKSTNLQDRLTWSKMSPELQKVTWRQNPPSR